MYSYKKKVQCNKYFMNKGAYTNYRWWVWISALKKISEINKDLLPQKKKNLDLALVCAFYAVCVLSTNLYEVEKNN